MGPAVGVLAASVGVFLLWCAIADRDPKTELLSAFGGGGG